jgi:cell wall-associated NlpC family hydrolase
VVSHRAPRRPVPAGTRWTARVTVLTAAAGAAAALTAAPAGADPDLSPAAVDARVDRLHEQAERATEKYNAAAEKTARLRERIEAAQDRAARGQATVNRLRDSLATLAGAQYRSGGLDPVVALMLSTDPDGYLDRAATLDRITDQQTGRLGQLRRAQRALEQYRREAGGELAELERQRVALQQHKKTVQRKLAAAQRLLNRLSPEDRAARDRASRGTDRAPMAGSPAASGRAATAVAAARRAVGSPYGWGQAGPSAFDCSGLTQWAYAQAGVSLPRTSQGQQSAGARVPLSAARPGDLVVYRSDASHVAMYMGNGQVVHAPYPGARVRYDPVGMMPVASVTRP